MTSQVDTSTKWARWTMPGAPVLTRAAGSLIALIDALCVDGWGLQTASSVVVADGFATATFPSDHAAAPHAVVLVAGVTGALAGLNGEQKVTSVLANKIRWATDLPDGTAAGTITVKMAPAGWLKVFSGTNLAAYKPADPAAHGQFLRVNDTTAGYCRAVGYENMTGISTGTGLFPSSAQVSGGYYWGKTGMTSGTSAVPWAFASDGRMLYLFTLPYHDPATSPEGGSASIMPFGDMVPEAQSGDPWATVMGGLTTNSILDVGALAILDTYPDANAAAPRARTGVGTSMRGYMNPLASTVSGAVNYPNANTGALEAGPIYWADGANQFRRARLPGLLLSAGQYTNRLQVPKFGIIGGAGPAPAYLYVPVYTNCYGDDGVMAALIDLSRPWR